MASVSITTKKDRLRRRLPRLEAQKPFYSENISEQLGNEHVIDASFCLIGDELFVGYVGIGGLRID